ncbi:MAG: RPA12/RPB9/RPC11 RNA polymerase family protein [Halobacteriota archaeon]
MQFCPECGTLMRREGEWMVCSAETCDGREPVDDERAAAFVTTESQRDPAVVEADAELAQEGLPTTDDVRCDDCGNERAWYTLKQTASADEPPTRFFKCTECGHRWRGYN